MQELVNISEFAKLDIEPKDSVIIRFGPFHGLDEIHALDFKLYEGIPEHIGEHDGHEVALDDSHGTLFTYGENAEVLFKCMQPILKEFEFLNGANVRLEFKVDKEVPLEIEFNFNTNDSQEIPND